MSRNHIETRISLTDLFVDKFEKQLVILEDKNALNIFCHYTFFDEMNLE